MNVLEWSRHFRCFPGQGALDVAGVVAAVLEAGYRGPLSLEVFSDVVREADPAVTARDAMRSLLFLEDQLAARVTGAAATSSRRRPPPPPPTAGLPRARRPAGDDSRPTCCRRWASRCAGRHRSKPVELVAQRRRPRRRQRRRGDDAVPRPRSASPPRRSTGSPRGRRRCSGPRWTPPAGAGEAPLPGITSPSGLHVFVSDEPGSAATGSATSSRPARDGRRARSASTTSASRSLPTSSTRRSASSAPCSGSRPGAVEEFMEPHGRLRSRALRPPRATCAWCSTSRTPGPATRTRSASTRSRSRCADVRPPSRAARRAGSR